MTTASGLLMPSCPCTSRTPRFFGVRVEQQGSGQPPEHPAAHQWQSDVRPRRRAPHSSEDAIVQPPALLSVRPSTSSSCRPRRCISSSAVAGDAGLPSTSTSSAEPSAASFPDSECPRAAGGAAGDRGSCQSWRRRCSLSPASGVGWSVFLGSMPGQEQARCRDDRRSSPRVRTVTDAFAAGAGGGWIQHQRRRRPAGGHGLAVPILVASCWPSSMRYASARCSVAALLAGFWMLDRLRVVSRAVL